LRERSAGTLYRLKREFRELADVRHPNLLQLYELLQDGPDVWLVMELVHGVDFVSFVRQGCELLPDEARLRGALRQLAIAVDALHGAGKLHLDLKPSNVLVETSGRVVVLDFGLVADAARPDRPLAGRVAGTPGYMAPEQAAGQPATQASDWYAFGVMLFESLSGRQPFKRRGREALGADSYSDAAPLFRGAPGAPSQLAELVDALLQRDPDARPRASDIAAVLDDPRQERAPFPFLRETDFGFVGRSLELLEMHDAYRAAMRGVPVRLHITGPSGIGKTTMVRRFLDSLSETGAPLVLCGRCHELESIPFKAVDSIVDDLSRHLLQLSHTKLTELLPPDAFILTKLFPVLAGVPSIALMRPAEVYDAEPRELQRRAFIALRALVRSLSDHAPVVLFIDDAQWGDADSGALLRSLLAPPDPPPVLVVVAHRPMGEEQGPLIDSIRKEQNLAGEGAQVRHLTLGGLSHEQARELAQRALHQHASSAPSLADEIAREAAGNPFFVTHLSAHAARTGATADGFHAASVGFENTLLATLSELSAVARDLVNAVALSGGPVPIAMVAAAALASEHIDASLDLLRACNLTRTRQHGEIRLIDTFHDRVRTALRDSLPAAARQQIHERLAIAAERHAPNQLDLLFTQHLGAGHTAEAGEYAVRIGAQAESALGFERAADFYRRAESLLSPQRSRELELVERAAHVLAAAGRGADAGDAYLRAAALVSDGRRAADLKRLAGEQFCGSGHYDRGLPAIRDALSVCGVGWPGQALAIASILRLRWAIARMVKRERQLPDKPVSEEEALRFRALKSAADTTYTYDNLRSLYFSFMYCHAALRRGDGLYASQALARTGFVRCATGDQDSGWPLIRRALQVAQERGDRFDEASAHMIVASTHTMMGNFQAAYDTGLVGERMLRALPFAARSQLRMTVEARGHAMLMLGRGRELVEYSAEWIAESARLGERGACVATGNHVLPFLVQDDVAGALAQLHAAQAVFQADPAIEWMGFALATWELAIEEYRGNYDAAWRAIQTPAFKTGARFGHQHAIRLWIQGRTALGLAKNRRGFLVRAALDARRLGKIPVTWSAPTKGLLVAGIHARLGRPALALKELERIIPELDQASLATFAVCARRARGLLVGGDEGQQMTADADAEMRAQGIVNPECWSRLHVPRMEG
jgi:serine/threonine protein kinase